MTSDEFRAIVLNLVGVTESSHMNHPDFRVNGRIFATLGYPDQSWGMVKLALQDQKRFVELHSEAFVPAKGAWGLGGSTMIHLARVKAGVVTEALDLAWQYSAAPSKANKAGKKAATKKSA
jgi:hypothetical protein